MSMLNLPLLQGIEAAMQWRDQNQKVIAGNVANSDTPGAKASKLKELDFGTILGGMGNTGKLQMASTNPNHMPQATLASGNAPLQKDKLTYEVNPDKNSIILEEQLMEAQRNASQYTLAANMYRKSIGMLKLAIGANR